MGDNAYAIRSYLLTPYRDCGNLTESHKVFNKKLSGSRVLIENTFGIFKGRFRQVLHLDMHYMSKITKFILACCVLHNLCIDKNDFIDLHVDTENLHNVNNELPLLVDSEVELRKTVKENEMLSKMVWYIYKTL